ncbi:MAG: pyrimidine reductase family protein [Actinomycetota bacterium]|nr:pyrimidine reductase family protein [Actinomycetota bacterium]
MRQLYPHANADVDPAEAYGRLPPGVEGRPALRLNMIASLDGAASVAGHTARLGGSADRALFAVLRSLSDVILVGAGTARAEGYGPVELDAAASAHRAVLGLIGAPAIAVLTRSCRLDWQSPLFGNADQRPLIVTTDSADAADRARAQAVADVIVAGDTAVNLAVAMGCLADRGVTNVLAEGGPHVSAQLAAAGLLDELCLTLAPQLIAGYAGRILDGPQLERPAALELGHVLESDGYLFLRYRRPR